MIDSTSVIVAVWLVVVPDCCTVAEAVAWVVPGTGIPVTLSM